MFYYTINVQLNASQRLALYLLLLSWQKVVSLLQGNSLSGVLVVWRESGRVSGFGDLAVGGDLVQSVNTLTVGSQSVHQMHFEG